MPGAVRAVFDSASAKVRLWQETAQWSIIAFAVVVGVGVLGWTYIRGGGWEERSGFFGRAGKVAEEVPAVPEPPTFRRALDGVPVPEGTPEPDYFAVAIDNIAEALPQSGVAKAPLVIEAPVEGGLTRLFAIFPSDATVEKLGPVRSARPYFVDWADEYGAMFVHVGGSPEALEKLKGSDVRDLNEFFNGKYFWRDTARRAPHNTYVSSEKLAAALAARPRKDGPLSPWKFKEDMPPEDRPTDQFEVAIGEQGKWRVRWRYDRDANAYSRILAAGPQKDADGTPILAKNVLVQFATVRVLDSLGRRKIDTASGGEAMALLDGRLVAGTWKRNKADGRTRFYDSADNELSINAGVTWIEVVPIGTPVTE